MPLEFGSPESEFNYYFKRECHSHEELWLGHLQYLLDIQEIFSDFLTPSEMNFLANSGDHEFIRHGLADEAIHHGAKVQIEVIYDGSALRSDGSYNIDPKTRTADQRFRIAMAPPPNERSVQDVNNATRAAMELFEFHHPEFILGNNPTENEKLEYTRRLNQFIRDRFYRQ